MSPNRLIPLAVVMLLIISVFVISWVLIDYDSTPEIELRQAKDNTIVFHSVEIYREIIEEHPDYNHQTKTSILEDFIKSGSAAVLPPQKVKLIGAEGSLLKIETEEGEVWYTTRDQLDQVIDESE